MKIERYFPDKNLALRADEFRAAMDKCWNRETVYADVAHGIAGDLMREQLRRLGYGDGVDVFETESEYYA